MGCVWHVNSNQGSDIHQAPWPTVRINLGRVDSQAHFFVSASICRCLSHFSLCSLSLSFCFLLFIHLPLTFSSHALSHTLYPALLVFFSTCPHILFVSISFSVCHQAVINQCAYLVGGERCEAWSLMLTVWWNKKLPQV